MMKNFYAVYSPRGFANELVCEVFPTKAQADEARAKADNDPSGWSVDTAAPLHRFVTDQYRKAASEPHFEADRLFYSTGYSQE